MTLIEMFITACWVICIEMFITACWVICFALVITLCASLFAGLSMFADGGTWQMALRSFLDTGLIAFMWTGGGGGALVMMWVLWKVLGRR